MYSKPLASRMDGARDVPVRAKRGATLNASANNFASYLPQNMAQKAAADPQAQANSALEQAGTQGNLGFNQTKALAALASAKTDTPVAAPAKADGTAPLGMTLNPSDLFKLLTKGKSSGKEDAETAVRVKSHRKSKTSKERIADAVARRRNGTMEDLRQNSASGEVGRLAARFESGKDGVAAVGYDRHGGTSYGKYQLSSRAGTMKGFIGFLQKEAPDIAQKLQKAGPANTGGRRGKMPEAWKQVANDDPARFEQLQDKFIRASHFEPAMRAIAEKSGLDRENLPAALQEVVFSTAVQHGPGAASRIISRALGQIGENKLDPEKNAPETIAKAQENLIRKIYQSRSGQFRSSTPTVQDAVKSRLREEMGVAITMLRKERTAGA